MRATYTPTDSTEVIYFTINNFKSLPMDSSQSYTNPSHPSLIEVGMLALPKRHVRRRRGYIPGTKSPQTLDPPVQDLGGLYTNDPTTKTECRTEDAYGETEVLSQHSIHDPTSNNSFLRISV